MTTENDEKTPSPTEAAPEPPQTVVDRFWEIRKELAQSGVTDASAAILTATEALCGELSEVNNRLQMIEEALLRTTMFDDVDAVDDRGIVP